MLFVISVYTALNHVSRITLKKEFRDVNGIALSANGQILIDSANEMCFYQVQENNIAESWCKLRPKYLSNHILTKIADNS